METGKKQAKKSFAILLLIMVISNAAIAATQAEINGAIEKGIAWLAAQQTLPAGYWSDPVKGSPAAVTGLALIKLQERAFELGYTPFDPCYPYKENVEKGLTYLFSQISVVSISTQPHGNPDTDGDGNGVSVNASTYNTGIALMAIAASRAPDKVVNSPGSPVHGWTYKQVLVDMVDYMAFGQCDSGSGRGGWGYSDINNSEGWVDNSNSGYAVSGLGFAESSRYGFNCAIPQFVKDELKIWIDYIQTDGGPDDGGSGYTGPGSANVLRTGNLVFQMTFAGIPLEDPNMQRALAYIGRKWNNPSQDPGWGNPTYGGSPHYQAMYCTANGLQYSYINTIVVDSNERDWYADFADALVNAQQGDGSWPNDPHGGNVLATEWALLTLEKALIVALEKVDDVNDGECVGPGDDVNYTICYSYPNESNEPNLPDINDVNIIDYLPDEVEFVSSVPEPNEIIDSNKIIWKIGTLSPGESGSVTLKAKVNTKAEPGSKITNECEIKSDGQILSVAHENTSVCCPTITKVDNITGCVSPGDDVNYSICYAANGYGDTNVVITDFLPNEVDFNDASGNWSRDSNTVTWYIGTLGPNESGCVTLTVKVNTKANPLAGITNCSQMSGDCIHNINDCENTRVCWPDGYIIYVDANAVGANNGTSWQDAFINLQDAIEKLLLSPPGSSVYVDVWVAAGTYKPDCNSAFPNGTGSRTATFNLINNVAIYGGFPPGGGVWQDRDLNDPNNKTILSGDLAGNDDPCDPYPYWSRDDNSYHVVTGSVTDETAILDGFTITSGNAQGAAGGGMCNSGGSPTITNCTFSGNSASSSTGGYGGGMYNYESSPTITNCMFSGNSAFSSGAGDSGGGMYNWGGSPTITNCTFSGNSVSGGYYGAFGGGGMYNYESSLTITNCTFSGNSVSGCYYGTPGGGGMYNRGSGPTITNCTFSGNSVSGCYYGTPGGGGMRNSGSSPTVTNCILWGNIAPNGPQIYNSSSSLIITYSDVQGDGFPAPGNIDADPCFVDAGHWDVNGTPDDANDDFWVNGNYRLLSDSPCIDAGDNNSVPPDSADLDGDSNTTEPTPFDLDGFLRFIDELCTTDTGNGTPPIVDMGAYEFRCRYAIISDLNDDCKVDFYDLKIMAENWLGSGPTADIEPLPEDGIVNFRDFAALAENWLIDCWLTPSNPACVPK